MDDNTYDFDLAKAPQTIIKVILFYCILNVEVINNVFL